MILFQFNFRHQAFAFKFKMGFFILCLFFFILFCMLGVWQLHRYAYKKTLLVHYQQAIQAKYQPFTQLIISKKDLAFQKTQVQGEYLNQLTMFLQNRFYHDQLGYDVLTPFRIKNDSTLLLIDRGWVAGSANKIPADIPPALQNSALGYIKLLNEYQFMLGENILNFDKKSIVMQKIDTVQLGKILHQSFYPFVLRLSADESAGFIRDWPIVMFMPERHMGYAIQWFVMAIVLLIAYCGFCLERLKKI